MDSPTLTKAELPRPFRELLELMQQLNYGRIESLTVRGGEPVLPPGRVVREVKFGGRNGPHARSASENFHLKAPVTEFFHHLQEMGEGIVEVLHVQDGLPGRMSIPLRD